MPRSLRHPALLLLALVLGLAADRGWAQAPTTIILVRHAEKAAAPADDPPLTAEGEARAADLVSALSSAGISAIYSTRTKRTQSTAAPIALELKVPVTTFDAAAPAYVAEILGKHRGKVVLVVGHSNTIPAIMRALGIADAPPIADPDYSNLFIVSVPANGAPTYIRAEFGR